MAKSKAPKAPREKKLKQQFLPDMEPPSVPEVDAAAEAYYDAKKERQALSQDEKDKKANLVEKMLQNGFTHYETPDGYVVDVPSKTNVTCKRKGDPEGDGFGGEE